MIPADNVHPTELRRFPDEVHMVCSTCTYVRSFPLLMDGRIDYSRGFLLDGGDETAQHSYADSGGTGIGIKMGVE